MSIITIFTLVGVATAFVAPSRAVSTSSSLRMSSSIQDLAGIPSSAEGGFFDPFNLSEGKDEETIRWYRAAELKHGRISMLATLGIIIQGFNTKIIPGFPVTETNEIEALKKVYYEAPSALVQILLAIAAIEVLCASIESQTGLAGDFAWDPANIRPKSDELLLEMQTKELKNGRLAMTAIGGMLLQNEATGQGLIQQLTGNSYL
eukprot:CAMPEP_0119033506 /NCGR_PEP_ID=MMETSP1177-20130426/549_1 /TAXON_ID=2985 /ORGANISM="Ochromonas sp, Strain CCMP1899" /LENGTH=204 /DNA_ID=CAMNT_0006990293 /DNA_START=97 /DNA_END=711 /DNA_ORIENTATION=+